MWVHISSSATGEKGAASLQEPLLASCQVRQAVSSRLNMDGGDLHCLCHFWMLVDLGKAAAHLGDMVGLFRE